jgi:hypothetical protein
MKRPSKKRLIEALDVLIAAYDSNLISHNVDRCPLCLVYISENKRINVLFGSRYKCNNCINTVFVNNGSEEYGCVYRGFKFKKLGFDLPTTKENLANHQYLIQFWQEVRDYLKTEKIDNIIKLTPDVKANILKIAEKYK